MKDAKTWNYVAGGLYIHTSYKNGFVMIIITDLILQDIEIKFTNSFSEAREFIQSYKIL